MTSDGGALLLQETDLKVNLLPWFSQCFLEWRNPDLIEHPAE